MKINLYYTTDVHGNVVGKGKGLARLKTFLEQDNGEYLLFDGGDLLQGSPLVFSHTKKNIAEENPVIKVTNLLKYDLMSIGNHEFNYGLDYLNKAINESNAPYVCSNINLENVVPYVIKEINGKKVLITQVCTHFVPRWEDPKNIVGMEFQNAFDRLKEILEEVEADFKIVLYHGGFERDLKTGELTEKDLGENQGCRMLAELDIDLFLTGHQHLSVNEKIGKTTVIQTPSNATHVAVVELEITEEAGIFVSNSRIEELAAYEECPIISNEIHENIAIETELMESKVAELSEDLLIDDLFEARFTNHPFARFINKVQLDVSGAEIACSSLFGLGFSKEIFMKDVFTNFPYSNTLKVVELTGKQIREGLEVCASYFEKEDGKWAPSKKFTYPKQQHYHYDLYAGFDYTFDLSREVGNRVICELNDERVYRVAMSNYRASGGSFYPMYNGSKVVKEITLDTAEMIVEYLQSNDVVIPENNMRIVE